MGKLMDKILDPIEREKLKATSIRLDEPNALPEDLLKKITGGTETRKVGVCEWCGAGTKWVRIDDDGWYRLWCDGCGRVNSGWINE